MQNRSFLFTAAMVGLLWSLTPRPAEAQGIERLGDFKAWSAYSFMENGQKTCYMASAPTKDEGDYQKRGDIYARITHRPAEKTRDEVSFLAGYSYKDKSFVTVKIGNKAFDLFTHQDTAWAPDGTTDQTLVKAMKAGNSMIVTGASSRGTKTKDTYSLLGFTKAYNTISKACGG